MKAQIHPQWHPSIEVACSCGNKFTTGSTIESIHVEVCSACHPFYTGQMRFIGGAGRVDRFRNRMQNLTNKENVLSKKDRRLAKKKQKVEEELSKPTSLAEIRKTLKN